jgi:hypothetical protein
MNTPNNSEYPFHPNWRLLSLFFLIISAALIFQGVKVYKFIISNFANIELSAMVKLSLALVADAASALISIFLATFSFFRKSLNVKMASLLYVIGFFLQTILLLINYKAYLIFSIAWIFGYPYAILYQAKRR